MASAAELLKPGIVFPGTDPTLAKRWLTIVHTVARRTNARVIDDPDEVAVGRSFCSVPIETQRGETLTVLLNPAAHVVACVAGNRPFPANATFVSIPLPDSFADAGFTVVDRGELSSYLTERDLAGLDDEEAQQVRYHRPSRVGDVIFNWFD